MDLSPTNLFAFVMLVVPVSLLGFGLVIVRRAGRTGGMHAGLARLVLDPARVRRFIAYLSVVLGSFLVLGTSEAISTILRVDELSQLAFEGAAFLAGSFGLVLLMVNGIEPNPLNLDEEQRLQDQDPELLVQVHRSEPRGPAPTSMYIVPQLSYGWDTEDRPVGSGQSSAIFPEAPVGREMGTSGRVTNR